MWGSPRRQTVLMQQLHAWWLTLPSRERLCLGMEVGPSHKDALLLVGFITLCSWHCSTTGSGALPPLLRARASFSTHLTPVDPGEETLLQTPQNLFREVTYPGPLGPMKAIISKASKSPLRPAIVWILGGFPPGGITATAWGQTTPWSDDSGQLFRKHGLVVMYPTVRGSFGNPGQSESFYGEVNDIMAAVRFLRSQPGIDPQRIYLGGHSTGGTLALLVAASMSRSELAGVLSFGPVTNPTQYGAEYVHFDATNLKEQLLRSPMYFVNSIQVPTLVVEGLEGNVDSLKTLQRATENSRVQLYGVPKADHWSVLAPVLHQIAPQLAGPPVERYSIDQEQIQDFLAHLPPYDPRLLGTWCIKPDSLVFSYEAQSEDADSARRQWARSLEKVQFEMAPDGVFTVREQPTSKMQTQVRSNDNALLFSAWEPQRPRTLPFSHPGVVYTFTIDGVLMLGGPQDQWYQAEKVGSGDCWGDAPGPNLPGEDPPPAPWMQWDPSQRPQILLTNYARFSGDRHLEGASAYLIQWKQQVFAATAEHLLGPAGGIEPAIPPPELAAEMESWHVFPRTQSDRVAQLPRLATWAPETEDEDWMLLHVEADDELPAVPLQVRHRRARVGESVFVVACEHRHDACQQRFYGATIADRRGNYMRIQLAEPADTRGFSGAPVIDLDGRALGIFALSTYTMTSEAIDTEAGAFDIASAILTLPSEPTPQPTR